MYLLLPVFIRFLPVTARKVWDCLLPCTYSAICFLHTIKKVVFTLQNQGSYNDNELHNIKQTVVFTLQNQGIYNL